MSLRSGVLVFFGLVLAAGLGAAAFFWYDAQTVEDLTVTFHTPDEILVGAPFDIEVELRNESSTILKDVKLTIEIPDDMVFVGATQERTLISKTLGNLGAGSLQRERFKVMVLEGENSIKRIIATVAYQPGTLSSRFEKQETADLAVGGAAILLDFALPERTFSGEEIELKVSYQNLSGARFSDLELELEYPGAFSFTSASPAPDLDKHVWRIGDLATTERKEIKIKGVLVGPERSFFPFRAALQANFFGRLYAVSEKSGTVAISESPLSLEIVLQERPEYVARAGEYLTYRLTYRNRTEVGLRDAIIRARLTGAMFDLATLTSRGFLRSADNTVVWNASSIPDLALIPPGGTGSVDFNIRLKEEYPIRRLNDKNFMLKVDADIESPTVPPFVGAAKAIGIARMEAKVMGKIKIDARAYFRDAPADILNQGPMPPVVGQKTQVTVHWTIWNYGTDVSNVELSAFLGGNVRFTGLVKSNIASAPGYNERTQKMVWMIDKILATKGALERDTPIEAVFQIEFTPAANQVGQTPVLVQNLSAQASDDFTGQTLTSEDGPIDTSLRDDPTVTFGSVLPAR